MGRLTGLGDSVKIIHAIGLWAVTIATAAVIAVGIFIVWVISAGAVMVQDLRR